MNAAFYSINHKIAEVVILVEGMSVLEEKVLISSNKGHSGNCESTPVLLCGVYSWAIIELFCGSVRFCKLCTNL